MGAKYTSFSLSELILGVYIYLYAEYKANRR